MGASIAKQSLHSPSRLIGPISASRLLGHVSNYAVIRENKAETGI